MFITLKRTPSTPNCTIGRLFVDGLFECYTLEDVVREKENQPVQKWKVAGKTAIPSGKYKIIINMSNRFKKRMPLLLNVPGFEGIRIHAGNRSQDTEGCICVGRTLPNADMIGESKLAYDTLFAKIDAAYKKEQKIFVTITNGE